MRGDYTTVLSLCWCISENHRTMSESSLLESEKFHLILLNQLLIAEAGAPVLAL